MKEEEIREKQGQFAMKKKDRKINGKERKKNRRKNHDSHRQRRITPCFGFEINC